MVLIWEEVKCEAMTKSFFSVGMMPLFRAKVPGGWFIQVSKNLEVSAYFYPDPEHLWTVLRCRRGTIKSRGQSAWRRRQRRRLQRRWI